MIDKTRLHLILNEYKKDFLNLFWNEKYKWIAVKHFQDNWDINAENFTDMLTIALDKTANLLTSRSNFPRSMIIHFSEVDPEAVRTMFRKLYDENVSVVTRVEEFMKASEELRSKYNPTGWQSHYQNPNSITTYLWLKYPDKYYIYKYSECKEVANEIDMSFKPTKGAKAETLLGAIKMYDEIAEYLATDSELIETVKNSLDSTCYSDPFFRTLAVDVGFYISRYYKDKIRPVGPTTTNVWWPSLDEYNPNLSKSDWKKYILTVEMPHHPSVMSMLKAMIELGGEASCKKLANLYGGTPSVYVGYAVSLGKRAKKHFDLSAFFDEGKERFYPIPFLGQSAVDDGANVYIYKIRNELFEALRELDLSDISPYYKATEIEAQTDIAKNTILYGPPGTGKTYNTVCYAVAIIENKKLTTLLSEASSDEGYSTILKRYNHYRDLGLIEFTTFHQSYGYEEFIEGIKPLSSEEESTDISYAVTNGVFKTFCLKANNPISDDSKENIGLNKSPSVWKVSLYSTGDNAIRTDCLENDHIRIGWDDYGPNITSETDFSINGGKNVLNSFIYKMNIGDIVLSCYSNTTIDAIGVIIGDYEWSGEYDKFNRVRSVKWLVKDIRENIVDINNGTVFTLSTIYKTNISVADVMAIVKKHAVEFYEQKSKAVNRVFIIDEINRGNISKIFGELITLIEPTKRVGASESLKAILPYSYNLFGVPDNVYIIGTMNTADRSIATVDTALRRRFDFVEMMPNVDILSGIVVEDIEINKLLAKINERISVLFDREHTVGHAYFIPLKVNPSIQLLANIFENKIIPLLQEYFFEDYEKIRLVLADNQTTDISKQFITAQKIDYLSLFGNNEIDVIDEAKQYSINQSAFECCEAYIKIYNI